MDGDWARRAESAPGFDPLATKHRRVETAQPGTAGFPAVICAAKPGRTAFATGSGPSSSSLAGTAIPPRFALARLSQVDRRHQAHAAYAAVSLPPALRKPVLLVISAAAVS